MVFLYSWLFLVICLVSDGVANLNTDRPSSDKYERISGQYIGKYTLGQSLRVSPAECAQVCDVTPKCMGLNYYNRRGRCEMLTHSIETVPSPKRIKANPDVDHYIRLDAEYECPHGAFAHPYKPRCYEVVNTPMDYYAAMKHCSSKDGQLALIPNKLTRHAVWDEVDNRLEGETIWLGIQFARKQSYLKRAGQKAFFMWFSNLLRGKPEDNRSYCGAALKSERGKFDYYSCKTERPFLCEFRSHTDIELNELCPGDTALFDGNCYWSEEAQLKPQEAANHCAQRGGKLAAFPSEDAIEFIGSIWEHVVPDHITESWIGLNYRKIDNKWYWTDGEEDMDLTHWSTADELREGVAESCGTALRVGNGEMSWKSRNCDENRTFLCMGQSGVVMSRDCPTKECPPNSVCTEGPFEAACSCKPGYVTVWKNGQLSCTSSSICQASGDPHYYPWDGGKVHYQGLCEHLLTGTCPEAPPTGLAKWMVKVFNSRRDGYSDRVAFTEYTTVEVYDQSIQMGIDGVVLHNRQRRLPEFIIYPFNNDKYIEIIIINGGYRMRTDFGLVVTYKNYRVTVEAPDEYANTTCGICGNWNGIMEDDLGHDQDKWLLPGDKDRPECQVDDPFNPIECDPEVKKKAEKICGKIHTLPVLDECRQKHPDELASFYDDCMEDACAGNIKEAICDTMEALVEVCLDYGCEISPSYRAIVECELPCPPNSSYQPTMSLDVATCQNPDGLYVVSSGIGEDCKCDPGFVKDGFACKPITDCGCLYEEEYIYLEIDERYVNKDCSSVIICKEGGELVETPIQCGDHAVCELNEDGEYECACEKWYEGNPYKECQSSYGCDYPMPGTGELIHLEPGESIVNSECEIVSCLAGDKWEESETKCVEHARCLEGGPLDYYCDCNTGYEGNGTKECYDPGSGTGDPHFMLSSHSTGEYFCFDVHGFNGEVWRLIEDKPNDLFVNGELFEPPASTPERPLAYFSNILIRFRGQIIVFTIDGIHYNNMDMIEWGKNVSVGLLHHIGGHVYEVEIAHDIVLRVKRTPSEDAGYYLGIFIYQHEGFSQETSGVLGQFIHSNFHVDFEDNDEKGTVVFDDYHQSVKTRKIQRFNLAHGGQVECWLYNARYGDNPLLGEAKTYKLNKIMDI